MKVKDVFICANGLVLATDENGEQISELQGIIFEVMEKIGKAATAETIFHAPKTQQLDVVWYFKKEK